MNFMCKGHMLADVPAVLPPSCDRLPPSLCPLHTICLMWHYPPLPLLNRFSGIGYPADTAGFQNSLGVEFRASPASCVAIVSNGISAQQFCSGSDSAIAPAEVRAPRHCFCVLFVFVSASLLSLHW